LPKTAADLQWLKCPTRCGEKFFRYRRMELEGELEIKCRRCGVVHTLRFDRPGKK